MAAPKASPLSSLPKQSLTPSGLLLLDTSDGEVQLISRRSIELRTLLEISSSSNFSNRSENLTVTLTTHRIVFQTTSPRAPQSHFLHLSAIKSHSETGGNWTTNRSYKIHMDTLTYGPFYLIFRKGKQDRDDVFFKLSQAFKRRQWEESTRLAQKTEASSYRQAGRTKVGVDAILTANTKKHEHNQRLTQEAFSSSGTGGSRKHAVDNLMEEAGELISVIQKYVATLEKHQASQEGQSSGEEGTADAETNRQLTTMMQDMGMTTALTAKETSRSVYYETLARQLSDYLRRHKTFERDTKGNLIGSGIMTLTDIYCLFNRARGTNMISPEELLEALGMMEGLGLNMKLREFDESGVVVLQEAGFDDAAMAETLLQEIKNQEEKYKEDGEVKFVGMTVLEAARVLKLSPLLTNEQLGSAERSGALCRDVTLEGTRFFRNIFV